LKVALNAIKPNQPTYPLKWFYRDTGVDSHILSYTL
jgi:hypothetical protein